MRVSYHANDLAAATDADANNGVGTNPTNTSTFTLDITAHRFATRTAQTPTGTLTRTNRYGDGSDSPAWTNEGNGTTTRNITGATGDLTAIATLTNTDTTGAGDQITWQLTNLHGDVTATVPANTALPVQINRTDEYGVPLTTGTTARYGYLGAKQRAADTPGGLTLMGVRLYNPATGRFLSPDPIYGGNANAYTYPGDPVNSVDLTGLRRDDDVLVGRQCSCNGERRSQGKTSWWETGWYDEAFGNGNENLLDGLNDLAPLGFKYQNWQKRRGVTRTFYLTCMRHRWVQMITDFRTYQNRVQIKPRLGWFGWGKWRWVYSSAFITRAIAQRERH